MAKQTGDRLIQCTLDGVCFYEANGEGLARVSNPPEAKRVKKAAEFKELRRYSDYLKLASPLASAMHKKLPVGRQRHHYQRLTGVAIQGLKRGVGMETVIQLMEQEMELICSEIREGRVTAMVHGRQSWAIHWKDGEPVLKKRRRKTAILKSSASVQQQQEFEARVRESWELDSLKLGVESEKPLVLLPEPGGGCVGAAKRNGRIRAERRSVGRNKPDLYAQLLQLQGADDAVALSGHYRRSRSGRRRYINFPVRSRSLSAGFCHPPPG